METEDKTTEAEKQQLELTAARSGMIDAASELISDLGKNEYFPCDRTKKAGAATTADATCVAAVSWGRPLSKKEYHALCPSCRAYWHASAMRNDMIEFMRTRQ
jgi:hypothetical protein